MTKQEIIDVAIARNDRRYGVGRTDIGLNDILDVLEMFGSSELWRDAVQRYQNQRRKVYFAYMRSAAWKRKRSAALEIANYRCVVCKFAEAKQAHHLTYDRLGNELPEDLQALCVNCHRRTHGKGPA